MENTNCVFYEVKYVKRHVLARDHWLISAESKLFISAKEAQNHANNINSGKLNTGSILFRAATVHPVKDAA